MSTLNNDLYSKLLNNTHSHTFIADNKAVVKGSKLDVFLIDCDASISYLTGMTKMSLEQKAQANFFALADYLTYVPYGSAGYENFAEILREVDPNLTVSGYRFNKFKDIMKKDLTSLPKEQIDYIKSYFDSYDKNDINVQSIPEIVSMICRMHHECEANYGNDGFVNNMEISEKTMAMCVGLTKLVRFKQPIKMNEVLSDIPKPEKLTTAQVDHIKKVTGFCPEALSRQP